MRKRWIQIDHELVEVPEDYQAPSPGGTMIMPDIKPYRSMIDGHMVNSRSDHRVHLKLNGCIEVGNETKYLKQRPVTPPAGLREAISRVVYEKVRS